MRRLGPNTTLVIATHNAGKLREIADLLTPHGLQLISAGQLGLPEPAEDAPDFVGNARLKARAAATAANLPALSDDSGFCVAALDGAPGVHSARFAGPDKNFTRAMADIHAQIKDAEDQRAWFICALCLAWPDGHTETFVGRVDGVQGHLDAARVQPACDSKGGSGARHIAIEQQRQPQRVPRFGMRRRKIDGMAQGLPCACAIALLDQEGAGANQALHAVGMTSQRLLVGIERGRAVVLATKAFGKPEVRFVPCGFTCRDVAHHVSGQLGIAGGIGCQRQIEPCAR